MSPSYLQRTEFSVEVNCAERTQRPRTNGHAPRKGHPTPMKMDNMGEVGNDPRIIFRATQRPRTNRHAPQIGATDPMKMRASTQAPVGDFQSNPAAPNEPSDPERTQPRTNQPAPNEPQAERSHWRFGQSP